MKKIAFTLQIFALIAMFPLYVVVELNRDIKKTPAAAAEGGIQINEELLYLPYTNMFLETGISPAIN